MEAEINYRLMEILFPETYTWDPIPSMEATQCAIEDLPAKFDMPDLLFRDSDDFVQEAMDLFPESKEKAFNRLKLNYEYLKQKARDQTEATEVQIVTSHGFWVDQLSVEEGVVCKDWCQYCAITLLKIDSNGNIERIIKASDAHVKSKST